MTTLRRARAVERARESSVEPVRRAAGMAQSIPIDTSAHQSGRTMATGCHLATDLRHPLSEVTVYHRAYMNTLQAIGLKAGRLHHHNECKAEQ
mmetsp:Transcript_11854/g.26155  ORF Transcript_11854/g.26155 Transcript_11854/m.26155 type:complete len:93 (-) Transcript_11854:2792-3070(-)